MKTPFLISLAILLPSLGSADSKISSPDKRIQLNTHAGNGQVAYSVEFNGKPLIAKSRLGVILNKDAFSDPLQVTQESTTSHDETWKTVWGQKSEHRDHYNQLTLELSEENAPKRKMEVILRAYNDGIAFRYAYPEQPNLEKADLKEELSAVSLISKKPIAWYPSSSTGLFNDVLFKDIKKPCRTPFTVKLADDQFISLHEAGVVNSSDAMLTLGTDKRTLTYTSACKQGTGTTSPWRSIQIADNPGELVAASLIPNLNEKSKVKDSSWIKPGVSLWDWRNHGGKADDGFIYGITTASYLRYIDFAAENDLAYVLIDAEWYGPERDAKSDPITTVNNKHHNVDMDKISAYAKEKGVGMWVYINDKGLKHHDMDRTFAQYQKWGIKGIKHGFLGGGNQTKNAFSVKVLEKCAEYQIMYNLHEPNKPTGLARPYPHYMSNEYVNSMLDAVSRPPATPSEMCTFSVVHNLGGPVDRSCGLFDMDQSIGRAKVHKQIPSTVASQVAQCLIIHSGILTLPDMPDAYNRKKDLFEFITKLPMTYDDTKVLDMEIGNHLSIARRSGDTWFVASLADEEGRKTNVILDFLEDGITYDITIYEDAEGSHYQFPGGWNKKDAAKKKMPFKPVATKRELYKVSKMTVEKGDIIKANIAPGGGQSLWIRPQQ
ncbi:glycoside hydrolase family 97 protein [Akkermansiaceae bacterium]|nr:glycoside hydrolase family 97 protein [Akkermansiaceae bacterium]MDB4636925.1 glycoside hydrolase family 97 protein [bacterium]